MIHIPMVNLKIVLPILLVVAYTVLLFMVSSFVKRSKFFVISRNEYVSYQAGYQLLSLGIVLLSLVTTYFLNKAAFVGAFTFGDMAAPAEELDLFGIQAGDGWVKTGVSLTLIISLVTGIFMSLQLKKARIQWKHPGSGIAWILLFALTNSFAEEMIYRLGVVIPLTDQLPPLTIYIISAVLFGLPHIGGTPGGFIGAVMAAVLGFVLAKSLYETHGFFWAWCIHFIQDVIIMAALFLLAETQKPSSDRRPF